MAVSTIGELLADRYRVVRRLGSGGMATVFLAEDERLGRRVAVKRLHAGSPEDAARRFRREARVGASLNHPNIVAVYDIVADREAVLIVMEYVEGETLRVQIARGPLPPARTLEILAGVASALDYAHEHGVVHRDVRPPNVLLGRGGAVKLADLGIATAAENTRITRSGTVLGTVAYMAPERFDGAAGGAAADVYALAAVAYEALTGEKAFDGRTAAEVARRAVLEPPPDLTAALPDAPPAAAAAITRALAKDPDERPASGGAFVASLSDALAPLAADLDAPSPGDRDRAVIAPPANAPSPGDGDRAAIAPPANAGTAGDGDGAEVPPAADAGTAGDGDGAEISPPANAPTPADGDGAEISPPADVEASVPPAPAREHPDQPRSSGRQGAAAVPTPLAPADESRRAQRFAAAGTAASAPAPMSRRAAAHDVDERQGPAALDP